MAVGLVICEIVRVCVVCMRARVLGLLTVRFFVVCEMHVDFVVCARARARARAADLSLASNPFGDEGLAALVAPPAAAGAPPTGGLAKLDTLYLSRTQITDAGCSTLAAALDSGALPALLSLHLRGIPASAVAKDAVYAARPNLNE